MGLTREVMECVKCSGWGFVLGTDTEDKFGDICDCGCDIHRPMSPSEHAELQMAHDRARVKAATAIHMKAFDSIVSAFR
jgi:hypothetical protein